MLLNYESAISFKVCENAFGFYETFCYELIICVHLNWAYMQMQIIVFDGDLLLIQSKYDLLIQHDVDNAMNI